MENENQVTNEVNEEPMTDEEMATDTSDLDNGNSEGEAEAFGDDGGRKHRQSAKENAKQAEKRRARESMSMTERDEIILETLGRKNPFTGGDMADSEDVEEYLLQKEISEKGGDPVGDLAAYRKQKAREKRAAEASEVEGKQRMATELNEFREKFPNVNVQELLRDEDFAEYADGKLGRKTISAVYEAYVNYKNKLTGKQTEAKEEAKAAQANANKKASVGSLHSSHKESKDFFTPDQVRAMSRAEVKKNFDAIKESMKKWK
jgi:hypothetical protein